MPITSLALLCPFLLGWSLDRFSSWLEQMAGAFFSPEFFLSGHSTRTFAWSKTLPAGIPFTILIAPFLQFRRKGSWAFPIFGITKTSVFLTNAQSRYAYFFLDSCLGPVRLLRLTLYLCSSTSNKHVEVECPLGALCRLKKTEGLGSCWKEGKREVFPTMRCHWFARC